jgi:hypothetical protein
MKMIIGICGKASSGKDLSAEYLVNNYGYQQLSLAEPIKDLCEDLFGFTEQQLWGSSSKRNQDIPVNWNNVQRNIYKYGPNWLANLGHKNKIHDLYAWKYDLERDNPESISARVALQTLGTEFGRNILGENIWINNLLDRSKVCLLKASCQGIVASDVRFHNEMEILHNNNGKIIRLLRNQHIHTGIPGHQSEIEQDTIPDEMFSCILNNNSSVEDLYYNLDLFMDVMHG